MGPPKRFTTGEAVSAIERAARIENKDRERELTFAEVIEMAEGLSIGARFVEMELLRTKHSSDAIDSSPKISSDTRLSLYGDGNFLVLKADPVGWTLPIVARAGLWTAVLGFIACFVFGAKIAPFSVLATLPFVGSAAWSLYRLACLAQDRVSIVLSKDRCVVHAIGPSSSRELHADRDDLSIEEPRLARDPEGGLEVFPLYYLRLRTSTNDIDVLHGHREVDLRRIYEILKAWKKDGTSAVDLIRDVSSDRGGGEGPRRG